MNKSRSQKNLGHEKKWVPKKFRPIKNIDPKNFGSQKVFVQTFMVPKYFGSKKILGPEKF